VVLVATVEEGDDRTRVDQGAHRPNPRI
jgi:hypothetical protein